MMIPDGTPQATSDTNLETTPKAKKKLFIVVKTGVHAGARRRMRM